MCGRYLRSSDKQRIAEAFHLARRAGETGLALDAMVLPPWDYNVAPTTHQPVIRQARDSGERELVLMRWGMVPFFTKDLSEVKGVATINARAESILSRPMWRVPFERRRCLVPADGFYEWKKTAGPTGKTVRQAFAFRMREATPFAFAGLWDAWKDAAGGWLQSFSIITTDANAVMAPVHDRMPVILHPRDYDRWLARPAVRGVAVAPEALAKLALLLRPFEAEAMVGAACNPLVGSVKNNGPEMLNSA